MTGLFGQYAPTSRWGKRAASACASRCSNGTPAARSRSWLWSLGTAGTSRWSIPVRWKAVSAGGSASGSKPGRPRWSAQASHMNFASHDVAVVSKVE